MSVKVPIYVNEKLVGEMAIVRQVRNLPPGNADDDWRAFEYRWEVTQTYPHHRRTSGRCFHTPRDGVWKLVAEAMKSVPGWVMNHD
jgi:hypothetical protein